MELACEAAYALADFAYDPMELLTACKRLVERRPACGPLVWVCARILSGSDPVTEAYDCVAALQRDRTAEELANRIPSEASVLAVGFSEASHEAARWRPDIDLTMAGAGDPSAAPPDRSVDLVILEADVVGDREALLRSGARDAALAARQEGTPVWLVAGLGRVLLDQMWTGARDLALRDLALRDQRGRGAYHGSEAALEVASLDCVDSVVGPSGLHPISELRFRRECPIVPELFA